MINMARENRILPILATEVTICGPRGFKEAVAALIARLTGKESYQNYVNNKIRAVNLWVREYSRENNLIFLDFEAALSDKTGARKKEYAEADGSHISTKGYEKLVDYINAQPGINGMQKYS